MYELIHTKTRNQHLRFQNIQIRVDGAKEWRHGQMELDEFSTARKIWQDTSFTRDSSILRSIHKELWTARRLNFRTRLKSEFAFFQSLSRLSQPAYFVSFCQIQANPSGVEFLRTTSKFRKTKKTSSSLVYVLHKTRNTGHSHVVVVQ